MSTGQEVTLHLLHRLGVELGPTEVRNNGSNLYTLRKVILPPPPHLPTRLPPSSSPISNHYRYKHIIQKIILAFYALSATLVPVLITAGTYVIPIPVSFLLASFPVGLFICCTDCPGYSTGIRFFPLRSFPLSRKTLSRNTG